MLFARAGIVEHGIEAPLGALAFQFTGDDFSLCCA